MARLVRRNLYSRKSLPRLLFQLRRTSPCEWPPELHEALTILRDELGLPNPKALSVIFGSVTAAHSLLKNENSHAQKYERLRVRRKVAKLCKRLWKCANRAPAVIRRRLDMRILRLIRRCTIDLEVIEAVFQAIKLTFQGFPNCEASKTALEAFEGAPVEAIEIKGRKSKDGIIPVDFSAAQLTFHADLQKAMVDIVHGPKGRGCTATVRLLQALAAELDNSKPLKTSSHELFAAYLAEIAEVWRQVGLRPTRARDFMDPTYKSRFHRFAELILTWLTESSEKQLPPPASGSRIFSLEIAPDWRISDDHVRAALKPRSNLRPQNPV